MKVVVDASVAVKWFVEEPRSRHAERLLQQATTLLAPDLLVAEVLNTAWKKYRSQDITADHAKTIVLALPAMIDLLIPSLELAESALKLALHHNHPVYDCLYVALAQRDDLPLVTDDAKLIALAKRAKLGHRITPLSQF
ncbi:MAG: PIN domain-containing protein [Nitrospirae bacterium]|nr:MAG: PIN domain-containing protein [Nitrospirota bacterium]